MSNIWARKASAPDIKFLLQIEGSGCGVHDKRWDERAENWNIRLSRPESYQVYTGGMGGLYAAYLVLRVCQEPLSPELVVNEKYRDSGVVDAIMKKAGIHILEPSQQHVSRQPQLITLSTELTA